MRNKVLFKQGALWGKLQTSYPQGNVRVTSGSVGLLASIGDVSVIVRKIAAAVLLIFTIGVGNAWGASVTLGPSDTWTGGKSGGGAEMSITKSGISVSMTSGYNTGTQVRYYSGASMTISSSVGNITQIQFTYTNSNITSASPGTWNQSNKKWTGNAASITFGNGGQVRITNIEVTYTAAASYTVTATRNDNSYGTVSVSGTTITATPSTCYQVASGASGYTVTSGTATVSHTGTSNTLTVTPSTNCTVQVNFEKQTVNTYVDEIQGNSDIEDCGTHDAPSLADKTPASSGTCAQQHWHFMGWVTAANKANPTDANIITPGTEMTANGTTYYAVWAKGTSGGGFDNTAGGTFKIYADVSGTKHYAVGTGSKISSTTNSAEATEYTFEKQSAGVYYIKTGTTYITYSSSSNLGTNTTGYSWTVTTGTKGSWRLTSGTSGRGWIFRASSYNQFGGYSTGNVTAAGTEYYDVEIGGGYEFSDYICTCCTSLATINGSVTLSQSGTSVTVKDWTYTQGGAAAESNIATYDVYLYSDADSYADPIQTQTCAYNAKATGVTFTSLSYGTTYKIKIGATGKTNYCDITPIQVTTINSTSTQTFQLACDVPTNVAASSITASSATVSWDDVATNYQYVLDQSSSDPAGAGTAVNGAHSVDLSALSPSTTYYFHVRTNCGNSVFSSWATISFNTTAAGCSGQYTFAYGATPNADGKNIDGATLECFSRVGETNEYQVTGFTIPTTTQYYWVGYNGAFYNDGLGSNNASSSRNQFKYMPVANLQGSSCGGTGDSYKHAAAGAYGTLRIYSNYPDNNLYVGFVPAGYFMRYGTTGQNDWANIQMSQSGSVWTTDPMDLTAEFIAKKFNIRIFSGASYDANSEGIAINNWTDGGSTISSMQRKTNSGENWASGVSAGMRGFFRTWTDNCANNGYCHFVPTHRVVFHPNYPGGGGPADTYSVDVSVEETNNSIALASAPSAPTGYTFAGWYDAADGGNHITTARTISAGASANVELWAHWTANTISLTLNKNNEDASGSTNGSASVKYNATALESGITHATRAHHTLEGYYADAGCTHKVITDAGVLVDYTGYVESGKWVRTTTPTTLYAKWEAENFEITWLVNGSAAVGGSTSADYGTKVLTLPTAPTSSDCDDEKVFVGWTNAAIVGSTDTKPPILFKDAAGSPAITEVTTFHAVFADGSDLELVTNVSQLSAGSIVTIASVAGNSQSGAVIKAYPGTGNNWPQADVTTSASGKIAANTADMQTFTLEEGTQTGTWAFFDGTGYPYAASSSSNHMKHEETKSDNSSFTISIDGSTSVATVTAQGTNTRNLMRYNGSNNPPIFSCYGSGQNDIYLYLLAYSGYVTTCESCDYKVTLTKGAETNGSFTLNKSNGSYNNCTSGLTVTVSGFVPATGYEVKGVTETSGDATVLGPDGSGNYTVTYTADKNITSTINVNFGLKSGTLFTLVDATSLANFALGDKLIITNADASAVMSTTQNNNNRGQVTTGYNIMSSTEILVEDGSDVQIITLEGSNGEWMFNVGNSKYLAATGTGSNNYLKSQTEAGDKAKWNITLSNDAFTIKVKDTDVNGYLRYNSSSSIFSAYSAVGSQNPVKLYRYASTEPVITVDQIFLNFNNPSHPHYGPASREKSFTAIGANLTGNVTVTAPSAYEISTTSETYSGSSTLTITPTDGSFTQTIYVRLKAGTEVGVYGTTESRLPLTLTGANNEATASVGLQGEIVKANLGVSFSEATYTAVTESKNKEINFSFDNLPAGYAGTITYTRSSTPSPYSGISVDDENHKFNTTASGQWTITASFGADSHYNAKANVSCTVIAKTMDIFTDAVNSQVVTDEQRTDDGINTFSAPRIDDVSTAEACAGTKVHLIGWATAAFVANVGNGTLSGAKSDYTEANGFYVAGSTLPAANGTTYYAVWGEEQ